MKLNQEILTTVVEAAKLKCAGNEKCTRAIDRAVEMLAERKWLFDYATGAITVIGSKGQIYHANGVCQCAAYSAGHTMCKHRIGARLLVRYYELERLAAVEGNAEAANGSRRGEDAGSHNFDLAVAASNTATANDEPGVGDLPAHLICGFCLFGIVDGAAEPFGPVLHERCAELLYPRSHEHFCSVCLQPWFHSDDDCARGRELVCLECFKENSAELTEGQCVDVYGVPRRVCGQCLTDVFEAAHCPEHRRAPVIPLTPELEAKLRDRRDWAELIDARVKVIVREFQEEDRSQENLSDRERCQIERDTAPLISPSLLQREQEIKFGGISV